MGRSYRIGEAAALLGVRRETIRRWEQAGKVSITRSAGGQRLVPPPEVARLLAERRGRPTPIAAQSARNHFRGVVTAVRRDRLVATVELVSGPHRILALTTREAVDELQLRAGMDVVASVKATNVVIEIPA